MKTLVVVVGICCLFINVLSQDQPLCDSKIFCQSELLDKIQRAQIYDNSKTFVDMKMTKRENVTLADFQKLLQSSNENPSKEDLTQFVNQHFEDFSPFDDWTPSDYTENPAFLAGIQFDPVKDFAQNIVKIWPKLAKKIKQEVFDSPQSFSLIPMKNGYIVSDFDTMQFNYWENYWIVRGLLFSEMFYTAKGVLENFLSLVEKYGFVPSDNRVYSLDRTQPPLLTLMVFHYIESTEDVAWLEENIATLDKELTFWLKERTVEVKKDGNSYTLARYGCENGTPRPDAYYEDVKVSEENSLNDSESKKWYAEAKSTVESGWDFSSRWNVPGIKYDFKATKPLKETHPREVIPVDLNAFLCQAFRIISDFYTQLGNTEKANFWSDKSTTWQKNIEIVLYNEKEGIWFDFNLVLSQPNAAFYPSTLTPLFCQAHNPSDSQTLGKRALQYLNSLGLLDYPNGIPTSRSNSGLLADYPNAWAVLQHIVVFGLHQSGDEEAQEAAQTLCSKWLELNYNVYNKYGNMYDTYRLGEEVDTATARPGFGCTNGADLILINDCFGYGPSYTATHTMTTVTTPKTTTAATSKIPSETTPKNPTVTTPKTPTATIPTISSLPTVTIPDIIKVTSRVIFDFITWPFKLLVRFVSSPGAFITNLVNLVAKIVAYPFKVLDKVATSPSHLLEIVTLPIRILFRIVVFIIRVYSNIAGFTYYSIISIIKHLYSLFVNFVEFVFSSEQSILAKIQYLFEKIGDFLLVVKAWLKSNFQALFENVSSFISTLKEAYSNFLKIIFDIFLSPEVSLEDKFGTIDELLSRFHLIIEAV